jgi:hypothetical protein
MSSRDLLPDERHILDVLLAQPFEGRDELREQARFLTVTGPSCACGCRSVDLSVNRSIAASAPNHGMVADGVGVDADGHVVGVLLFVGDDGYLSELEIYGAGGDDTYGRPTVESFEVAVWEQVGKAVHRLKNTPPKPDEV